MVALREIFDSCGALEQPRVATFTERNRGAVALGEILKSDFEQALQALVQSGVEASQRRALVRCFGSVIEGLANALRTIAETVCAGEGRQHQFRKEKAAKSCATALQRICVSYRVIIRCLPGSPLTCIGAKRFDQLNACLEIRNRVVHPETASDLEISDNNIRLITDVGRQFIRDFETLARWQAERGPHVSLSAAAAPKKRRKRRRGGVRFRKCHCGSGQKYNKCCRAAERLAA